MTPVYHWKVNVRGGVSTKPLISCLDELMKNMQQVEVRSELVIVESRQLY